MKAIAVLGVGAALVASWALTTGTPPEPYHMPQRATPKATVEHDPVQPTPDCQEDQPCWDCGSMGNMICGTWADAKASADACGGTVYFHKEGMYTTVCPV
jgi:hypothetical protein